MLMFTNPDGNQIRIGGVVRIKFEVCVGANVTTLMPIGGCSPFCWHVLEYNMEKSRARARGSQECYIKIKEIAL
jgi:hypothetical protein